MLFIIPLILIVISFLGIFFGRKNIILVLICLELLLLGILFQFVLIGWCCFGDFKITYLGIILLTIGAAESAIGLAIVIAYYKILKW